MNTIPKIIHQIWIGPHPRPAKLMQTWKDKHPEYQFIEWNDEALNTVDWRCKIQIEQMKNAQRWNGLADILRYEILHEFGGFVAPADSVCLNPIDDLLPLSCFCCYENEEARGNLLSPHLGAAPGNLLMNYLVDVIQVTPDVLYDEPWRVTGNALLTGAVRKISYPIIILPSYSFIPNHYTGVNYKGPGKVYADHLWGSTKGLLNNLDNQYEEKK